MVPPPIKKERGGKAPYLNQAYHTCLLFLGGFAGGYFFNAGLVVFYFIPLILLAILYYDLSSVALHRLMRLFSSPDNA
jgi:hypothetical protein